MRHTPYVFALATVFLGVGGYYLGHLDVVRALPKAKVEQDKASIIQTPDSQLLPILTRMEQRLELLEARQGGTTTDALPKGESADPIPKAEQIVRPSFEEMQDHERQIAAEVQRKLSTEQRDNAWSAATEEQIQNAVKNVSGEGRSYSLSAVSCLTSICKLVVKASQLENSDELMRSLAITVQNMAEFKVSPPEKTSDGSYQIVFELFRKGYPLPGQG